MGFRVLFFAVLIFCFQNVHAQFIPAAFEMQVEGVASYSDLISTPQEVIGHKIGERHTTPRQIGDYFEALAAESDRITVQTYGYTYDHRPLIYAIVTSPANHARLEEIRQRHLLLSESPNEISDTEIAEMPVVIFQAYAIHGNEASTSEAALLYLYHLAAGQGGSIDEMLENAVIIIDPLLNPDGRDRFVDWVNGNRGGVHTTDPQNREHIEAWPGGRTNHYWFDLNRDWLPAQHPESQGRLEVFHAWRPQVLTDFHEMGSSASYFFMPGIPSRNNPVTPERNFELTAALADYHAEALDDIGSLYYSKESFDDFYYGKGSTYPDGNGTIGILFEQASSRALERDVNNGRLHYSVTVENQFATSLSTLKGSVALKDELLKYHREYYATSSDVANSNLYKAFIISLERDRTRGQLLAQLLQRHRIKVYDLANNYESNGRAFGPGSAYIVPVDQRQARLVKSVFEKMISFQDSLFYDVSTWTMPLAYDVDYAEVTSNPSRLIGDLLGDVMLDGGERIGGRSSYAYLMEWDRYFAPRALFKLQSAGIYPRLLHRETEITVGGTSKAFSRGTIVIPVISRDRSATLPTDELEALIDQVVAEDHVRIYAAESGFARSGVDLGSRSSSVLAQPRIALLTGSGSSAYNAGEVWHLLSERYHIPVSLLDVNYVSWADLSRYNTIIMAGGSYSGLATDKLTEWIRDGGHLITLSSASNWAVRNDLLDLTQKEFEMDSLLKDLPYDQLSAARGAQFIGGAIFEAELDVTHPLAYGFRKQMPFFRNSSTFFEAPESPGATVAVYSEDPLLSGYVSEERLEMMPGSAALVTTSYGSGQVVAFMDNPNFRAFWYGTSRLFMNSVFLTGSF